MSPIRRTASAVWSASRKTVIPVAGWLLIIAGVIMMVAPGPGLVFIAAGLALLARKYVWARNALNKVKAKIAAAKEKRKQRRR